MRHDPKDRSTQRSRLLALLIGARGRWVGLPEILQLGVAQYNARLFELRRLGFHIENRRDGQHRSSFRLVPGCVPTPAADRAPCHDLKLHIENWQEGSHSWFRLVSGPTVPTPAPQPKSEPPEQSKLFEISPERYPD